MSHDEKIYFAARLKAARRCAGFKSARQFLKTHNIPHSTYMQYESGTRLPTDETITEYSNLLRVNFEWLKNGSGDPLFSEVENNSRTLEREGQIELELRKNLMDIEPVIQPNCLNDTLMSYLIAELIMLHQQNNKAIDGRALGKIACKMYTDVITKTDEPKQYLTMAKMAIATYQNFAF